MSIGFNAIEIFQIAEQIEGNGAKFYRRAAEGFEDPAGRKLLAQLRDVIEMDLRMILESAKGLARPA